MSFRHRIRRKHRIFLVALVIAVAGGGVAYVLRERQLDRRAVISRDQGLRLLEAKEYFEAMHKIGPYVRRNPEDAAALFAYAQARQQVPEPNGKHISETFALLRRVLSLTPEHAEAAETLLRLYQKHGRMTEALQLAQDLLARDATNRAALQTRAAALYALGSEEAQGAAEAYTAAYPDALDGHLLLLDVLQRKHGREKVLERCAVLRSKSPEDPAFQLLTGVAYLSLADRDEAKRWIEQAAQGQMSNPEALRLLVDYCDRLQMFDRALEVLRRHGNNTAAHAALLANRLWEHRRDRELVEHVHAHLASNPHPAALRLLALYRLGEDAQLASGLRRLEEAGTDDAGAHAWAAVVRALTQSPERDDGAVIAACQQALKAGVDGHAHLRFLLAEAYLRGGEGETAIALWQEVTSAAPGWAAPIARLAQAALRSGHFDEAAQLAEAALARAPDDPRAMLLLVEATAGGSASLDEATATRLLDLLDRAAHAPYPARPMTPRKKEADTNSGGSDGAGGDERDALAALRVQVLALAGRKAQAIEVIRSAIDPAARSSAAALLRLATVSQMLHLGLEEQCLQRYESAHGWSADLAFMRAKRLLDLGRRDDALALFADARKAAAAGGAGALGGSERANWDRSWAHLLELSGDGRAKAAWVALAEAWPNDPLVQWMAIGANSVQDDREFIGRTLDRLKARLGDQGLTWRLSRARYLLAANEKPSAVEAALILNDLTRTAQYMLAPRLLLADCLHRLGNVSGAIDQLTAAANLQPQSVPIALQLAALLRERGETARARTHLDRVLKNPASSVAQVREAAHMLDADGDTRAALAALERAYGPALSEPPPDLLLAKLYRKTNQIDRVVAICKRTIDEKPDLAAIAFAADFYTTIGRSDEVAAVLQKLESVDAAPGEREIVLGNQAVRAGDHAKAAEYFTAAVSVARAAPEGSRDKAKAISKLAWRQLIRIQLTTGAHDAAVQMASAAAAMHPEDEGLAAFDRRAAQTVALKDRWPDVLGLLADLLVSADVEPTLLAATEILARVPAADVRSSAESGPSLDPAGKLSSLAATRPQLFSLQVLAARTCLAAKRTDEACVLAHRAAQLRPEGIGLALEIFGAAGRWSDVASVLRPTLKDSGARRIDWMKLAGAIVPDASMAAAWLHEVEGAVLAGEPSERLALAECWQELAKRSAQQSHAAKAVELTRRVADELRNAPTSPEAMLALGCLQEAQGEAGAAEQSYRKALELRPDFAVVQNNLAMLLARGSGGDADTLDEALRLATQACASADPSVVVSFYDTLAFIQAQRREYQQAVDTLTRALQLKPDHLWCQLRLTDVFIRTGQMDKARASLAKLEQSLRDDEHSLAADASAQLADLRAQLARPTS